MQSYFNSANGLTVDWPLLAYTKYFCWIKPIVKCLHCPKSNANGIFQIVYNCFSPLSVQYFFSCGKSWEQSHWSAFNSAAEMTEVRKNAMVESLYPTQSEQTKETFCLKIYFSVHEWIYAFLEESKKALSWSSYKVAFSQRLIYHTHMGCCKQYWMSGLYTWAGIKKEDKTEWRCHLKIHRSHFNPSIQCRLKKTLNKTDLLIALSFHLQQTRRKFGLPAARSSPGNGREASGAPRGRGDGAARSAPSPACPGSWGRGQDRGPGERGRRCPEPGVPREPEPGAGQGPRGTGRAPRAAAGSLDAPRGSWGPGRGLWGNSPELLCPSLAAVTALEAPRLFVPLHSGRAGTQQGKGATSPFKSYWLPFGLPWVTSRSRTPGCAFPPLKDVS